MKDFLNYFILPLLTALLGMYLMSLVVADSLGDWRQSRADCEKHLVDINAPRKTKCEVFVDYRIVEEKTND